MVKIKTWLRRLSFRGLSIQQRLPLLICVLLLSVVITGGLVSYLKVKNDAIKTGGDRLVSSAEQLSVLLAQSTQNLITAGRSSVILDPVAKYLQTKDGESYNNALNALNQLQDTNTVLIEVLDLERQTLLQTGTQGIEKSVSFASLEGIKSRPDTGYIGNFYLVNEQIYFPIVTGVVINNKLAGYILKWRRVTNSSRSVDQVVRLMGLKDAQVYFGNRDNSLWTDMRRAVANPLPANHKSKDNILSYKDENGRQMIAASRPVKGSNWVLLMEGSQEAIMQPAKNFLKQLVIIAGILLIIGIFWAWMVSRNITRPLYRLTAATSAIAGGNYSTPVKVDRRDEVGKLAIAFNAMIAQLGKARERLEQKVVEAEDANEQLRKLSAHLQNIREEERIHIAREMHDELGQLLTGFKMDVAWLNKRLSSKDDPVLREKLEGLNSLVDESVKFVRKLSAELRPSILDDLGLIPALEWHSREFEKRYNIHVDFQSQVEALKTSPLISTGLFRMYQESLTNVARHSGAEKVTARLEVTKDKICLSIRDNGKGFDTTRAETKTLGLLGMRERAIMLGGELEIKSEPGKGTVVFITVPLLTATSKLSTEKV
jgi:signal transduction histidine kinase